MKKAFVASLALASSGTLAAPLDKPNAITTHAAVLADHVSTPNAANEAEVKAIQEERRAALVALYGEPRPKTARRKTVRRSLKEKRSSNDPEFSSEEDEKRCLNWIQGHVEAMKYDSTRIHIPQDDNEKDSGSDWQEYNKCMEEYKKLKHAHASNDDDEPNKDKPSTKPNDKKHQGKTKKIIKRKIVRRSSDADSGDSSADEKGIVWTRNGKTVTIQPRGDKKVKSKSVKNPVAVIPQVGVVLPGEGEHPGSPDGVTFIKTKPDSEGESGSSSEEEKCRNLLSKGLYVSNDQLDDGMIGFPNERYKKGLENWCGQYITRLDKLRNDKANKKAEEARKKQLKADKKD